MRRAGKIDTTQRAIVEEFRKYAGVKVCITSHIGEGFPDLIVRIDDVLYLVELKSSPKNALTAKQIEFIKKFGGKFYRLDGPQHVQAFVKWDEADRWASYGINIGHEGISNA